MGIKIHGAGCCLMDLLYQGISFENDAFQSLSSRSPGDGGLIVGGLVFASDLERFAGRPISEVLNTLAGGKAPAAENVGGPAIVSLVHTAQLLPEADVDFFGVAGNDGTGEALRSILARTPVRTDLLRTLPGATPATHVFNDPNFDGGSGERLFINQVGAADLTDAGDIPDDFLQADIVQFGGTALVPPLHRRLPELLERARGAGAFTIVNTVYDFAAERNAPDERWTLGADRSYQFVDLLITDLEEARRLTLCAGAEEAVAWFLAHGVGAAVVTCGADPVWYGTRSGLSEVISSQPVYREFSRDHSVDVGDTTGCGDNFCGGVVAAIAEQIAAGAANADLTAVVGRGIASGALCLSYIGGTMIESRAGEKRARVDVVESTYRERHAVEKRVDMALRRR